MAFNVSGPLSTISHAKREVESRLKRTSKTCHVGCTVDGVAQVGFPEQVFNSTSSSAASSMRSGISEVGMYAAGAMGVLAALWTLGL